MAETSNKVFDKIAFIFPTLTMHTWRRSFIVRNKNIYVIDIYNIIGNNVNKTIQKYDYLIHELPNWLEPAQISDSVS